MERVVAIKLLTFCGHHPGNIYGGKGAAWIQQKAVALFHLATDSMGVLVLTDLRDSKAGCAPEALREYILKKLPNPPKTFLCRFAVNELKSWLLADRKGLASFMGISETKMPQCPENEAFPKEKLVSLAHSSRRKRIREGIAPPAGHYSDVGPEYTSALSEFINNFWDIESAMLHAPSLKRCVSRLREL